MDNYDFKPNINIPADLFASVPTSGLGQSFQKGLSGFEQGRESRRKQLLQQQLAGMFPGNPQMAALAQMYPEQFMQNVLPTLLKQQTQAPMEQLKMQKLQQQVQAGAGGPQPTINQDLRKQMIEAIKGRTAVMAQRSQFGQIDRLAKATGIQPQLLKQIQTNNVRADRALQVLGSGIVYPQKLNLALVDLAGIMQGGAPQLAELHNTKFPTWKETEARLRLYTTGNPNTPVPPEVVNEVRKLVSGVKEVDNEYIRQNADFQSKMLGPTIEGFKKKFAPIVQQGTEKFIQGGVKSQEQYDPDKETRYQKWKKSHGY